MISHHTKPVDLVDQTLEGAIVTIFLEPDDSIQNRQGKQTYIESLELPHLILNGENVWGFQRHHCVQHTRGAAFDGFSYYGYASGADLFANVSYETRFSVLKERRVNVLLMSSGRYRALEWKAKGGASPVFSSSAPDKLDDMIAAIRDGARFVMALMDEAGLWHVHPVHYPFYYPEERQLHLQTEALFYPAIFEAEITAVAAMADQAEGGILDRDNPAGRERSLALSVEARSTYRSVFADQGYYGLFDLFTTENRNYR